MHKIETERLYLRPFQLDDMVDLFNITSDDEVAKQAGWKPHKFLSESADIILNVLSAPNEWAIVWKASNHVIGSISISEDLFDCEEKMLSFFIAKDYWQKGIGYEATTAVIQYSFRTLCLKRMYAYHFLDNEGSYRLIQKLGFIYQGEIKNGFEMYNGRCQDIKKYVLKNPNNAQLNKKTKKNRT